ncbi:asparagine synthase (glutamine-hydrolyzing) [Planctomycetota bacterium]
MCGIAGMFSMGGDNNVTREMLLRMVGTLRHRGPDQRGIYIDNQVGLAHARLSIIDLNTGTQPLHNENETLWMVYNGEIYNYRELREQLERKGHRFHTKTDGEVILHLYEEIGIDVLNQLNGQFAIVLWDTQKQELVLARDRCGIRPLFYTKAKNTLLFASEIKALFANRYVTRRLDPIALDQIATFWTTLSPRTAFEDIWEIPPGHYLKAQYDRMHLRQYWDVPLPEPQEQWSHSLDTLCLKTRDILHDAIRLRLRADVPIGCYLSGGLDSSILTTLVAEDANNLVRSFGIRFKEDDYDEGSFQKLLTDRLNLCHHEICVANEDIGQSFHDMVWHSERPILRTAPVPLFLLSRLVRDSGFKVVLSGEGADEVFGGYNIFREAKIRRFWARQPESESRAALIRELYPYVYTDPRARLRLRMFFARGLEHCDDPLYSHRLRWNNTSRLKTFFSDSMRQTTATYDGYEEVRESLPKAFWRTTPLLQAQYLEMKIFLSNYLLSSQGDRMAMAHSVEIRLPYLDHHLIEFMSRVPAKWKILGLNEKFLLKRCFRDRLPRKIVERSKQPYRAPNEKSFLESAMKEGIEAMLSESALRDAEIFDAQKTRKLLLKLQTRGTLSEVENMALVGILSTQSLHKQFIADYEAPRLDDLRDDITIDRRHALRA